MLASIGIDFRNDNLLLKEDLSYHVFPSLFNCPLLTKINPNKKIIKSTLEKFY